MVSILHGVKVSIFPIGNWRRRYNSAALPHSLWYTLILESTVKLVRSPMQT